MKYDLNGIPDIGLINADGTGKRNLTNSSDIYERDSKWSPNGQKILYSSYTITAHVTKLKVMELSSGKVTNIADSAGIGFWNFSK
jgi:Tol biopolymer transport system component